MANSAKKISPVILLVTFCIFAQTYPGLSQTSEMTVKGDVNGDGVVDWLDAYLTLQLSTQRTPDHELLKDADVNQDGKIGLVEAIYALQFEDQKMECGAYVAPGVWKEFDCYNLAAIGKTTNDDPFTPSWRLIGGYWQWGRKGPDPSEWYNTNTSHFAHGPTGPDAGEANEGEISGWSQTDAPDDSWSDTEKTAYDPCPDGFSVPTKSQWKGVIDNNYIQSTVGTWSSFPGDPVNYSAARFFGIALMLPAAGSRNYYLSDGALGGRGIFGNYWSSSQGSSDHAWGLDFGNWDIVVQGNGRKRGRPVRCVAEDSTSQDSGGHDDVWGDGLNYILMDDFSNARPIWGNEMGNNLSIISIANNVLETTSQQTSDARVNTGVWLNSNAYKFLNFRTDAKLVNSSGNAENLGQILLGIATNSNYSLDTGISIYPDGRVTCWAGKYYDATYHDIFVKEMTGIEVNSMTTYEISFDGSKLYCGPRDFEPMIIDLPEDILNDIPDTPSMKWFSLRAVSRNGTEGQVTMHFDDVYFAP
jgi:uncharacterized protein (TIGR02145 family)